MKRTVSILMCMLVICLVLSGFLPCARAAEATEGTCGDNLTWHFDGNETLTISGTGPMVEYNIASNYPWYSFNGKIRTLVIGDEVTTIGKNAFSNHNVLYSVTLGSSLTSIGEYAFNFCEKLGRVVIPDSVTVIGEDAFANTGYSTVLVVGQGNTAYTTYNAGLYDKGKTSLIWVPQGLAGSYVIPDTVQTICPKAFQKCEYITEVTIPDSVTLIGDSAFDRCSSLAKVTVGKGVTRIDNCAFMDCTSLTDVYYNGSAQQWGKISVGYLNEPLTEATLHTVEPVLTGITIKTLPAKTRYQQGETLDTTGLVVTAAYADGSTVDILEGFSVSGFDGAALGTQTLTVTYQDQTAAFSVEVISSVVASGTCGENLTWVLDGNGTLTITGIGAMLDYNSFSNFAPWYDNRSLVKNIVLADGITCIGQYAFYNCKNTTAVTIADSVTKIGRSAFQYCENLAAVAIPDSVTDIGFSAFYGCNSLKTVSVSQYVTNIGTYAFYPCKSLDGIWVDAGNPYYSSDSYGVLFNKDKSKLIQTPGKLSGSYVIPDSVRQMEIYAFSQCSLTEVTIGKNMTFIPVSAFYQCLDLVTVHVPYGITEIRRDAFKSCKSLREITIPDSVTVIGVDAFYSCTSLPEIYIPQSVASIGEGAFRYCSSMKAILVDKKNPYYSNDGHGVLFNKDQTVLLQAPGTLSGSYTIPESVIALGNGALSDNKLTEVTVGSNIAIIPESAFSYCDELVSVVILDGVTKIDRYAFSGCSGLNEIVIPDSVTTVESQAFGFCLNLKTVVYCGTEEQWNGISIDSFLNDNLINANRKHHDFANGICAACGLPESYQWVLSADITGKLVLEQDLYVDLNGYDLSGVMITNGYKVYGLDSTTNGYTCQEIGLFTCVDENGNAIVPQMQTFAQEDMRYLTIQTENGYSFHRFYLGITHVSIAPSVTGFGYKAQFFGDEMVQQKIQSIGYRLWLTEDRVIERTVDVFQNSLTLRLRNYDAVHYGETPVNASVVMVLADGTVLEGAQHSQTLRQAVETVNAKATDFTAQQLTAVRGMILANPVMQTWLVDNIYSKESTV